MTGPGQLASGKIDRSGTTLTLYRDGTFTTTGFASTSPRDRLLGFSFDVDSMRRKSVTGRGAAFLLTGGISGLASNNRGVIYVTLTGERSGTRTYTIKNPETSSLASIRSLKAAADALLASPPIAAPLPASLAGGPYEHHPVLSALPLEGRSQIQYELERNKPIAAIKVFREYMPMGLKEAKDVIDRLREFPDEGTPATPQQPEAEPVADNAEPDSTSNSDVVTQLKTLADLHATGALSDAEFAAAKARILS